MKATDFQWIDPLQENFADAWRIQEIINVGRAKDNDFYPASKKGHSPHVDAMHAANLIFALSQKTSKASIEKVLKMRYLLRSAKGEYFMNQLALVLTDAEMFTPLTQEEAYGLRAKIAEIRISTDRPYVEIVLHNPYTESVSRENATELFFKEVYSSDSFQPHEAENFTILLAPFLYKVSKALYPLEAGDHFETIRNTVRSFKKIQAV